MTLDDETATDSGERLYGPPGFDGSGYRFFEADGGWTWVYIEPGEDDEEGPWYATRAAALRGAADNWDETGGVVCRLARTLRAIATREERA